MLFALVLAKSASTFIDSTTFPHTVALTCRVVSATSDDVLQFAATVDYSGGGPDHNHHTRVLVKPVNNDFPIAETRPVEGGRFSDKPVAMVDSWRGQELFYSFELPSNVGAVHDMGVARMDIMVGGFPHQRIAAGPCTIKVEHHPA
jgi:hypothetical protein